MAFLVGKKPYDDLGNDNHEAKPGWNVDNVCLSPTISNTNGSEIHLVNIILISCACFVAQQLIRDKLLLCFDRLWLYSKAKWLTRIGWVLSAGHL